MMLVMNQPILPSVLSLFLILYSVSSFVVVPCRPTSRPCASRLSNDGSDGLVLGGDEMEEQMRKLRSKFPTSEADYLAAARQRATEARESVNNKSSDDDWRAISDEKRSSGLLEDDWEASLVEAGNADSQILIPMTEKKEGDGEEGGEEEGGEEEEPKLLLF